jgi:hypothetical protein
MADPTDIRRMEDLWKADREDLAIQSPYLAALAERLTLGGSYPWLIGTVLVLVSQVFFAAWFLAVGVKLHRMARVTPSPQAAPA